MQGYEQYRDRLVHEFDEDMGQYEQSVRQEVSDTVQHISYDDFYGRVMKSTRTNPDADLEAGEALEAYENISNRRWSQLDIGQALCLQRVANELAKTADDEEARAYATLQEKAHEFDYLFTLEQELNYVEEDYTVKDTGADK